MTGTDGDRPRASRRTAFAAGAAGLAGFAALRAPDSARAADLLDGRPVDLAGMTEGEALVLGTDGTLRPGAVARPLPATVASQVVPGPSSSAALQAELAAFDPTAGGVLLLRPGTYGLNAALTMRPNVTVRGVGVGRTVLRAGAGLTSPPIAGDVASGWALEDLSVDGNAGGGASGSCLVAIGDQHGATIRRVRLFDGAQGVYSDGDDQLLEDVQVDAMSAQGIVMNGAGCRLSRITASGVESFVVRIGDRSSLVDSRITADPASLVVQIQLRGDEITCTGNRIDTSAIVPPATGANATAIATGAGCRDLLIAGNHHSGRASGIFVGAFDQPGVLQGVRVLDNVLNGGAFDGILVGEGPSQQAEDVTIARNLVREIRIQGDPALDYGVGIETHCSNVLIVGNTVEGTDGGGIFALSGKDVSIVGNSVRNAGFQNRAGGIEFNTSHTLICGNQVVDSGDPAKPKGNSRAIGSYGQTGGGAFALDGLQIQGNQVIDHRSPAGVKYGIAMFAGDFGGTAALSGNSVRGIEVPFHVSPEWRLEGFPTDTRVLARQDAPGSPLLSGAAYSDVPGMAIDFVEPVGSYWLEFSLPGVETSGAGRLSVQVVDASDTARLTREVTAPGTSDWRASSRAGRW